MNHIYRIVWNTATACYQAVSESATGRGKGQGKSTVVQGTAPCTANDWALTAAAIGAALCLLSLPSFAGPAGGQVTAGSATITQAGTATTINQTSNRAAIDWTKFSVGANESVRFNQPSASALTLNRVTGTESSAIMGSLSANGQVFILNPNGVMFGAGAQVNVGGLVASTLQMSNANFMAGNYKFAGDAAGSVINNGHITVAPGGTLALMAPIVQNTGTLSAPGGSVLLAGAQAVTLTLQSNGGLVAYTLDAGSAQALVDNGGLIQAGGGHVVLTAKGVDALSKAVVNHSGVIEAQTVGSKNGVIELLGDMQSGTVSVSGKLDASAPNADGKGGDGGFIDTSAAKVKVADTAQITTASAAGNAGTWLIDPLDITINSGLASAISSSLSGGNVTISTAGNNTPSTASGEATGGNGDIFVNSAVNWSANKLTLNAGRNININANLNASSTAKLALEYGQATTTGAGSDYVLGGGAQVNLPAGQNFSTKQGSAGAVTNYTVITSLGAAGSTTGTDLQGINGNLAGNYVLGADIDAASTSGWNSGAGFNSIGKAAPYYTGTFSGLGHEISSLYINRTDSLVGLFGAIYGKVRNVGVVNANITAAGAHAGILAGTMQGTVSNSYSTGTIKNIVGIGSTGGLIGSAGVPATIYKSYSSASVEANHAAGGLVGFHFGIIQDSYATGKVFNNTYAAGGLVGLSNGIVNSSYSTGEVIGTARRGGLIGLAGRDRPATTTNSYWDVTTSKQTTSAGGTGKTTAQMQQQSTYVGWDFVNTWRIVEGSSYPMLRALTQGKITVSAPARDIEKVYDKNAWTGGMIDYSGFTAGDTSSALQGTLKWVGTAEGAVNAGNYTLVPTGLFSQKYEVVYAPGTLTIQPRPVDVAVVKTYDGNATFASGFVASNGVLTGDTVSLSGSATVTSANAGSYSAFSSNNLVSSNSNYTANPQYVYTGVLGKVAATIDPAALSLLGVTGSRVYDGTTNANWNDNILFEGVLSADLGRVAFVSGAGTLDSKNVGTRQLTSAGSLKLGGDAAQNYVINPAGSKWVVSPAELSLWAVTQKKAYDGTIKSTEMIGVEGLKKGDSVEGVQEYSSKNAGSNLIKLVRYTINDGNNGKNYKVTVDDVSVGTIVPRLIRVYGANIEDKSFDGTDSAIVNGAKIDKLSGDDLYVNSEANFVNSYVENGKTVPVWWRLAGNDRRNYELLIDREYLKGNILPPANLMDNINYQLSLAQHAIISSDILRRNYLAVENIFISNFNAIAESGSDVRSSYQKWNEARGEHSNENGWLFTLNSVGTAAADYGTAAGEMAYSIASTVLEMASGATSAKAAWHTAIEENGKVLGESDATIANWKSNSDTVIDLIGILKSARDLYGDLGGITTNFQLDAIAAKSPAAKKLIESGQIFLTKDGAVKMSSKLGGLMKSAAKSEGFLNILNMVDLSKDVILLINDSISGVE